MSRSYRKPCIKQNKGTKKGKIAANRCIRRSSKHEDIVDGNNYKKHYNSWNITDFKWIMWEIFKHNKNWCSTNYNREQDYNKMVNKFTRK